MWAKVANMALPALTVQSERLACASFIEDVMKHAPTITSGWWGKFRFLTAKWIEAESLNAYIAGFYELLEFCGRKGRTSHSLPEPAPPSVQAFCLVHVTVH